FSLVLLPLVVTSPLVFPFVTGKAFLFRAVTELLLPVLILVRIGRGEPMRLSPIVAVAIVFSMVLLLVDSVGVDPRRSIFSNFERMDGFVGFVHLGIYFAALLTFL